MSVVGLQILQKLLASPYFSLFCLAVALIAIAATFAGRFSVGMARWIIVIAWVMLMVWCYASAPSFSHQAEWTIGSMTLATITCFGLWKWVKSPKPLATIRQPASPPAQSPAGQQQTSSGNASVSDSGHAVLKDVGNPRITIYTQPPTPKPQPPKPQPPQPKSNISFKSVRPGWIWYSEHDDIFVEVENSQYASARGVIARFKNESAAHAADDAKYIRAELVFRDVNEQEMEQSVHAACWLSERTDTADFVVGEDHWLFLGAADRDDDKKWLVPWKQPRITWQGQYYELRDHMVVGMRSIEIRIIGEENRWLITPVMVDIAVNKGEPTVTVRPPVPP